MRKILTYLVSIFYLVIISLTIRSDFMSVGVGEGSLHDGRYFIALLLCCLLLIISGDKKQIFINKITKYILLFSFAQFLILFSRNSYSGVFLLRLYAWIFLFLALLSQSNNWHNLVHIYAPPFAIALVIAANLCLAMELSTRTMGIDTGLNVVYYVELGLPIAYLLKNRLLKTLLLVSIIVAVVLSMKATGMLALAITICTSALVSAKIRTKTLSKVGIFLICSFLLLLLFSPYVDNMLMELGLDWGGKYEDSIDSGGSGRLEIWGKVLLLQSNSSLVDWLMGHSSGEQLIDLIGYSSHNDFLEVLYDYGIIVFGLYIMIYVHLIHTLKKMIIERNLAAVSFSSSIVMFFVLSTFSHLVIYPSLLLAVGITWGLCLSCNEYIKSE